MRAVQVSRPGGPEALELVALPDPLPRPGEVRVRAEAIGVGRADVLVRRGTYKWMPPLPAVPGVELVGRIDAVGDGADGALQGRRVLVSARELAQRAGCYAEAICIPAEAAYLLPDAIDPVDALSLPNFQLARALLDSNGAVPPRAILVPGAAGAVGSALAQLARSRGIAVIGTASTEAKRAFARANGATALVDGDPAGLADAVMAATDGRGVDMAFDHLGGATVVACLRALAPLGMLVSYNVVQGPPAEDLFGAMRALLGRSLALRTFSMHSFDADRTVRRGLMLQAIDDLASGRVRAPDATVLPLDQVRQAHERLEARDTLGKIVLRP